MCPVIKSLDLLRRLIGSTIGTMRASIEMSVAVTILSPMSRAVSLIWSAEERMLAVDIRETADIVRLLPFLPAIFRYGEGRLASISVTQEPSVRSKKPGFAWAALRHCGN